MSLAPHAVDAAEVARELGSDRSRGLGVPETRARLARSDPNEPRAADAVRAWRILLGRRTSPIPTVRRRGVFMNRALVGAVALTVTLQVLLISVAPLRDLLGLRPLAAAHWLLVIAIALAYLTAVELDKAHQRRARRC